MSQQEYNVGDLVIVHTGANVANTMPFLGIITEVDKKYIFQPCIIVSHPDYEFGMYCYPYPGRGNEFNVEIIKSANND